VVVVGGAVVVVVGGTVVPGLDADAAAIAAAIPAFDVRRKNGDWAASSVDETCLDRSSRSTAPGGTVAPELVPMMLIAPARTAAMASGISFTRRMGARPYLALMTSITNPCR